MSQMIGRGASNPYLAMSASLVCGYIGMVERMIPAKAITGSAYNRARTLPRTLEAALDGSAVRLDRLNGGAPFLNSHDAWSLDSVLALS